MIRDIIYQCTFKPGNLLCIIIEKHIVNLVRILGRLNPRLLKNYLHNLFKAVVRSKIQMILVHHIISVRHHPEEQLIIRHSLLSVPDSAQNSPKPEELIALRRLVENSLEVVDIQLWGLGEIHHHGLPREISGLLYSII